MLIQKKLINKKLYLAAGVSAAFECKTTLKAEHIVKAAQNCVKVKSLYPSRSGTPYKELHSPVIYGLLAHSHVWKGKASTPEQNIQQKLYDAHDLHVVHPRLQLDLLCVADLATWQSSIVTFLGPRQIDDWSEVAALYGPNGSVTSAYVGYTKTNDQQTEQFTPIGTFISNLSKRLAWENPSLRSMADYYRMTNISGSGTGQMLLWPSSIYSEEIRSRVEAGRLSSGISSLCDEWSLAFH